ncbi:MAG TPA: hypothetical protein VGO86_04840 [Candidatus Dormibacteraeota bacterium]|jgi:hypothetical protein
MTGPIDTHCGEPVRSRQLEPRTAIVIGLTGIVLATVVIAVAHVNWP